MADNAAAPHLFKSLADERVLIGVREVGCNGGDGLIDEIAAGTVLRGGK